VSTSREKRTGRRSGPTQTREAIAAAARDQFAEAGYDRTTIRGIAAAAGVDAALVVHFFGTKDALFREVMALSPQLAEAIAHLAEGERETIGRRLAQLVVGALENPATRAVLLGRIRGAASNPDAAQLVRETVERDVHRLVAAISADEPEIRASLIGSQIVGLAFARHVVGVEPLPSLSAPALVDALAPVFQRYLTESLR
jgi:AcrR family transcriptional regulator